MLAHKNELATLFIGTGTVNGPFMLSLVVPKHDKVR